MKSSTIFLLVASGFAGVVCLGTFLFIETLEQNDSRWEAWHEKTNQNTFAAWVKLTENKNDLTYEEWLNLKNENLLNNP